MFRGKQNREEQNSKPSNARSQLNLPRLERRGQIGPCPNRRIQSRRKCR